MLFSLFGMLLEAFLGVRADEKAEQESRAEEEAERKMPETSRYVDDDDYGDDDCLPD